MLLHYLWFNIHVVILTSRYFWNVSDSPVSARSVRHFTVTQCWSLYDGIWSSCSTTLQIAFRRLSLLVVVALSFLLKCFSSAFPILFYNVILYYMVINMFLYPILVFALTAVKSMDTILYRAWRTYDENLHVPKYGVYQ